MSSHIQTGGVHHLTLTVNDVDRSREFYTGLLGFQEAMMFGPRALLSNGSVVLALAPSPDPSNGDRFDETRIGLDHLSFSVAGRDDLEKAVRLFDEKGVSHGEITDLGADLGIYILAFRDPDNIQVEMSAPYS